MSISASNWCCARVGRARAISLPLYVAEFQFRYNNYRERGHFWSRNSSLLRHSHWQLSQRETKAASDLEWKQLELPFERPLRERIASLMAVATKKVTIAIAAVTLAIAATWYAWKVSTFSSLSEADARWWIRASELLLLGATVLLTVGLLGEWSDSESWKARFLYKLAKAAVILGVVGELIGDGGIFEAGDRLQELETKAVSSANLKAGEAVERAAQLEKDAAIARSELEKLRAAASWREFNKANHDKFVSLVKSLPKPIASTVIFDSVVGNPEAKHLGDLLAKALSDALSVNIEEPRGLSTCLQCTGVWVCVNSDAAPETVENGKAIRAAFEQSGVADAKFCEDPKNAMGSQSTIKTLVGPKAP